MAVASARRPGVHSSWLGGIPDPPLEGPLADVVRWWPLRTFLDLGAYPEAVSCARGHAKNVVWEWGFGELARTCEVIVSELATNAVKASRVLGEHTTVRLWLLSDKVDVLMAVWDASHKPPVPVEPGSRELGDGGLGLVLVEKMSQQWGWHFTSETGGKLVWALCR